MATPTGMQWPPNTQPIHTQYPTPDPIWPTPPQQQRQIPSSALNPKNIELLVRQEPIQALAAAEGKEKTRKPVDPPPIIELRVAETGDPSKQYLCSPYLFMMAFLVMPEGPDLSPPIQTSGAIGQLTSSLYRLKDIDNKEKAFFVFGDISVRKPGKYRLKFSLFDQNFHPKQEVVHLTDIYSEYFNVFSSKDFHGMEESTYLSRSFNEQGVRLRMRKEPRNRVTTGPSYQEAPHQQQQQQQQQPQSLLHHTLPQSYTPHSQPLQHPSLQPLHSHPSQTLQQDQTHTLQADYGAAAPRSVKRRREETDDLQLPVSQISRTTYPQQQYQYPTATQYHSSAPANLSASNYLLQQPLQQQIPVSSYQQQPYFGTNALNQLEPGMYR